MESPQGRPDVQGGVFRGFIQVLVALLLALSIVPNRAFATEVGVGDTFVADGITYKTLSESTVQVGDGSYACGSNLTNVEIPADVTSNGKTYSVVAVGDQAFAYCSSLSSVTLPDSVTSLGAYAFFRCGSLTSANIPDAVTILKDYTFYGCPITSVAIPDSVVSIGAFVFGNCDALGSVSIPSSVASIGNSAFYNCDSLTQVVLPDSITTIAGHVFESCGSLNSVAIPDSVTSIGEYAFAACHSFTSIAIPDSVTSIGDFAFAFNEGLPSIAIPDSVTTIGFGAFLHCHRLSEVTLGNSVTSIGEVAFAYCMLSTVVIPESVTTIGDRAFEGTSVISVLPRDCLSGIDPSYTFTGRSITPSPTVTVRGEVMTRDVDYTVSYSDNVSLGTATVKVTGVGRCTGSVTTTFQIVRPSSITLTSRSASSLRYGSSFAVRGVLKSGGTGLVGRLVILQSAVPGASFKDTSHVVKTGAAGVFSFSLNPVSKTLYRVRFAGATGYAASGPTASLYVVPRTHVHTPIAPRTMSRSEYRTVYGYLKPKHTAGTYPVRIYKYRYSSGKWKRYGYVNAEASDYGGYTKYKRSIRLPYKGRWRLRAYAPADSGHASAWSGRYDYVTVK